MTIQPNYKTTATGSIDYAHYDRRARDIRSQDALNGIDAIGRMLKAIATKFRRGASSEVTPVSGAPGREPMRTPLRRRTDGKASQANARTSLR